LVVDLDGTLIETDMLQESVLSLFTNHPGKVFNLPIWLFQGRAALKRRLAQLANIDFETLPLNQALIAFLRTEKARGRQLVLATASDSALATPIAQRLGLFERVLASDGGVNLKGQTKADRLVELYGDKGFDYAGNDAPDLAVWKHAHRVIAVGCPPLVLAKAKTLDPKAMVFPSKPRAPKDYFVAVRAHQWVKNLLVFVPMLAAHQFDMATLATGLKAFLAFSLCASSVYLVNDMLDLTTDRAHPSKSCRPLARGAVPLQHGVLMAALLLVASFVLAWWVNPGFSLVLGFYYALTSAYSIRLKQMVLVDVFVLAALYTLRIFGGAAALGIPVSFWLLALSINLFLSLAMVKRYTELKALRDQGGRRALGRGYRTDDLELLSSLGGASGYLAALVLALYINSSEVAQRYANPSLLWPVCLLLLFWVSRVWLLAHRGEMHDDPVLFTLKDRPSQVLGLVGLGILLASMWQTS
jgi:4-hydroxybenzoate polyprenyltransferase/phosphoserine phosphatase